MAQPRPRQVLMANEDAAQVASDLIGLLAEVLDAHGLAQAPVAPAALQAMSRTTHVALATLASDLDLGGEVRPVTVAEVCRLSGAFLEAMVRAEDGDLEASTLGVEHRQCLADFIQSQAP